MPHNAEAGGGLMVAVIQSAIALVSTLGGLLFDAMGYRSTFLASAAVLLVTAFLVFLASRRHEVRIVLGTNRPSMQARPETRWVSPPCHRSADLVEVDPELLPELTPFCDFGAEVLLETGRS
ncbi:hypothetical protein J2W96_006808 [Variovorax guangxiensis]|nr:hypothetical protein [Variovorax guangxiensis]